MSTHALLSPSSAHRWSRCLGSVEATKDCERVETEHSKEGTLAHDIAAWALREKKHVSKHPEAGKLKPEDLPKLQGYVDRCRGLNAQLWRVEQTLSLDPHIPGQFGTADFWGYLPEYRRLYVIDLKFGVGERVFANYSDGGALHPNDQLLLYGYGALQDCEMMYDVDEIVMQIDQPRLDHLSTITLTRESLLERIGLLSEIANKILANPQQAKTPGDRQCRWCPIRGSCEARADWHLDTFKEALDQGTTMHVSDLAAWLSQAKDMEQWIHDIREEATRRLKNGIEVGGWKLVEGRARRVWTEEAAFELGKLLGEKAWKKELIGLTEATKLLGKDAKEVMDTITNKMPGAPTLAGPDDKRPALRLSASDDFNDANDDADMLG